LYLPGMDSTNMSRCPAVCSIDSDSAGYNQ